MRVKLPPPKAEEEEFGKGKKGIIICPQCDARYFKKSWHHTFRGFKSFEKDVPIKFKLCPADEMIKRRQYEGRIVIKNIPTKIAGDLERMIRGLAETAYKADPMDRLITLKKNGGSWEVTFTENQMARKIARRIEGSYHTKAVTKFAGEPSDVVQITVMFPVL